MKHHGARIDPPDDLKFSGNSLVNFFVSSFLSGYSIFKSVNKTINRLTDLNDNGQRYQKIGL